MRLPYLREPPPEEAALGTVRTRRVWQRPETTPSRHAWERGWRRCSARRYVLNDRLQREQCRGHLIGGCVGYRGRGLFEHEQPRARDLARERLAVADREEPVAATVHHERR